MSKTALRISKHIPSVLQQSMDFSGGRTFSLSIEDPMEPILLRIALALIVALLFGYLYFVSNSVLNVMARKEALVGISNVQSSISSMEQNYFALAKGVTPSAGTDLGLAPVANTAYVYRAGNTAAAIEQGNTEI